MCNAILLGHKGGVKKAKFIPNHHNVVSCSFDETIRLWE